MDKIDKYLGRGANIATILGVVGLVFGVYSVFSQLESQRAETARTASERTTDRTNQLRLAFMENPQLVEVTIRGMESICKLSESEAFQFENYLQYLFYSAHAQFSRVQETQHDVGLWSEGTREFLNYLVASNPGVAFWWSQNAAFGFSDEFREEIPVPKDIEVCEG